MPNITQISLLHNILWSFNEMLSIRDYEISLNFKGSFLCFFLQEQLQLNKNMYRSYQNKYDSV